MEQNNPYINQPNIPDTNNTAPHGNDSGRNPYASQAGTYVPKREDTVYTKTMKEHFSFFGIGSLLYSIFFTFCLYKNASGITYPFFVIGTLCYFFFSTQKLGVPYKKDSIFYIISIVLLGISNCLTNSEQILAMNKCGIFLLAFILMLHTFYQNKDWNFPKYFCALGQTIGIALVCVSRPISDMISYFDTQKKSKTGKKSYFLPVLIGIVIMIPTLLFVTILLASADAVFADIFSRILKAVNLETIFGTFFMTLVVFFASYAFCAAFSMKEVKEETTDHRFLEPIIAIIVTVALSVIYLLFSVIQILYLFIGNMQLPEGYTYSSYAREGFFQLLAVCILNLMIVLICLYLFRENIALKLILTVISGCTFIMIASSALRMIMYINRYNLTFLRIFVLWSLAVIFLLMAGVTISIYKNKFPLFIYSMVIVTVFYIGLSFSHPDYWIARYNLDPAHIEYLNDYDVNDSKKYLRKLSADAAPILLNINSNPYLAAMPVGFYSNELENNTDNRTDNYEKDDILKEYSWLYKYYGKIKDLSNDMHIRNFNFSVYTAEKYIDKLQ
ncbi:MAG: DUF4173 domain-containing protein [Lachnospiraceae bacterium]|nr:DUF4173 domain-containing protein [Lachnospiraceae bacterium]